MDLVFFGSGTFGLPTLAALAERHRLVAVVTQPDKPAGRGGEITPTPVGAWAAAHVPGVPLLKPARVNEAGVVEDIRAFPAAAWVVIAFGQKLGKALLAERFAINLHASLLPRWRGAAPINAAVLAGDSTTGNSVITLAERMDAGVILGQSVRPIGPLQTAGELHDLLASDGPALVERVLTQHESVSLCGAPQDESLVTIAPKLSRADAWVDWSEVAERCRCRIHGMTPWPGVGARLGDMDLKLCRSQVEPGETQSLPGSLIDPAGGLVACGGGSLLRLLEIHPAGKRRMAWAEFARGQRLSAGATLASPKPPHA